MKSACFAPPAAIVVRNQECPILIAVSCFRGRYGHGLGAAMSCNGQMQSAARLLQMLFNFTKTRSSFLSVPRIHDCGVDSWEETRKPSRPLPRSEGRLWRMVDVSLVQSNNSSSLRKFANTAAMRVTAAPVPQCHVSAGLGKCPYDPALLTSLGRVLIRYQLNVDVTIERIVGLNSRVVLRGRRSVHLTLFCMARDDTRKENLPRETSL